MTHYVIYGAQHAYMCCFWVSFYEGVSCVCIQDDVSSVLSLEKHVLGGLTLKALVSSMLVSSFN